MNELYQTIHPAVACMKCPVLTRNRHHVVWSRGPEKARIMAIGEAPGYNEDVEGLPFIGKAGQAMATMMNAAGLDHREIHIANRIMCHPPGNRDPEPDEIANCMPWLIQHIGMVEPQALLLFGRFALALMFDKVAVKDTQGLMHTSLCFSCGGRAGEHFPRKAVDGSWVSISSCEEKSSPITVAAIYHPASIYQHQPENEPLIVHQLTRLREELELLEP